MTAKIGSDIYATTQKLDKLAQLAQSTSLFDDPTSEINELTFVIKQNIASLNSQLGEVQGALRAHKSATAVGKQQQSHTQHIVENLKSQLYSATKGFQEVLYTRSQNIKAQESRRQQIGGGGGVAGGADSWTAGGGLGNGAGGANASAAAAAGAMAALGAGADGFSPLPVFTPPKPLASTGGADGADGGPAETIIDIGQLGRPTAGEQVQLQQLMPARYLESRATAVESVQSTIVELGGIFQQLQNVVAEQAQLVERIDADVEQTAINVDSAQAQLMRYYRNLTSNRPLMLQCAPARLMRPRRTPGHRTPRAAY